MNYQELQNMRDSIVDKQEDIRVDMDHQYEMMLNDLSFYLMNHMGDIVSEVVKEQAIHTNHIGKEVLVRMKNDLIAMQVEILNYLRQNFHKLTRHEFMKTISSTTHTSLVRDAGELYDHSLNEISEIVLGYCGSLLSNYGYEIRIYERTLSDWLPNRSRTKETLSGYKPKFLYSKFDYITELNQRANIKKHKDLFIDFYAKEDRLLRISYEMEQILAERLWDSI